VTRILPRFVAGQNVTAMRAPLNRIVDRVNKLSENPAGPAGADPGFLAHTTLLLEIQTLNAANLTCIIPDPAPDPTADLYVVELPQTFNETSRGGVTYVYTDINNRTADGTEVQQLTPSYIVGDLVVATSVLDGQFWIDMNIDGRQWARVPP